MALTTNTDAGGGGGWHADDTPSRLREWGAVQTWKLPLADSVPATTMLTIGTEKNNWIQFPDGHVSKVHAKLVPSDGQWMIVDLKSKNGIWLDGERRVSFPLSPGIEIGIGFGALIVESPRIIELHALLERLIGWSADRRSDVDIALRLVRMAATRRGSLALCGEGDVIAIAQILHHHVLGADQPFIVCDPHRQQAPSNARAPANYSTGIAALEAATGGTLCVWKDRKPDDYDAVTAAIHAPGSRAQLVICTHEVDRSDPAQVVFPPLSQRAGELDEIIEAFGDEAATVLGGTFTPADLVWVRREEGSTLADIERAAQRLVAYRMAKGKVTVAAKLLGMSHSALSEWLARRPLPL